MKKVIQFLSAPAVNLILGLLLYLCLSVVAIDIYATGFNGLVDKYKSGKDG